MTTWTELADDLMSPTDPDDDLVPDAVCPSRWEISHARKDIVTQVVLGRDDGGATAQVTYNDSIGQAMYGIETPFSTTDLTCEADLQLERIATRLFRTRGKYASPRVNAVLIDANTNRATNGARDLLAEVSPFEPSRYRCRHILERGTVFDTTYMVTGVQHHIAQGEWTARISLDLAAPWAIAGSRFNEAVFNTGVFGEE